VIAESDRETDRQEVLRKNGYRAWIRTIITPPKGADLYS
jgi:hypothetical protein